VPGVGTGKWAKLQLHADHERARGCRMVTAAVAW
jgi:hypothetical protein